MAKSRNSSVKLYLGWNVGGTNCSAVIGTPSGKIVERRTWPSNARRGPERMIQDFLAQAAGLRQAHRKLSAVGVSIGGPLDAKAGIIYSPPHLPGWDNIPLREVLTKELRLPVRIEHDAVACLAAEWLWGVARGATHAVYFTAGTGFGAGIMINRSIVRGPSGQTTEIGHVRLADDGPVAYGKRGSVESFCSGTGMAKLARELYPEGFDRGIDPKTLCQMTKAGSAKARKVLNISARWTGRVCAMMADLFSPEVIILGSMARYLPAWWMQLVRQEFVREGLPRHRVHARIVAPGLGDSIQDLSAITPCLFPYQE